jgi:type II secretory pathway pseudopilin PulG
MTNRTRRAFTLFHLLIALAVLLLLFALLLPAVAKARLQAARSQSANNMKQLGLACHSYHDAFGTLPPGVDDKGFSLGARILPFIEQDNVYKLIDFNKSVDDKANAQARALYIKVFTNPLDSVKSVSMDYGPTNYLFCAGSKPDLTGNDGFFYLNSKHRLIDALDGTSNTMMATETLKGDSAVKATTMVRQHVLLKKEDLKGIKPEAGVEDFKNDKNIAADRCASWMDGRFLQGTFSATRKINDERPDVNCGGAGGLSGPRTLNNVVTILLGDGSVHAVTPKISMETLKALSTRNGGEVIGNDF